MRFIYFLGGLIGVFFTLFNLPRLPRMIEHLSKNDPQMGYAVGVLSVQVLLTALTLVAFKKAFTRRTAE